MSKEQKIKESKGMVYLEINDLSECSFELWEEEGGKNSHLKVKMPMKSWKKILKNWDKVKERKDELL